MKAKGKNANVESSFNECFKSTTSEGKKKEGKKAGPKNPYPGYNPQKGVGNEYKP